MPTANTPKAITIRTYQVGFGDCFLLTFHYPKRERHMLIDFGSTKRAAKGPTMQAIADDVAKVTKGKLHVVVATHRHADHISGFAGKPGATIAKLQPDAVLQPWTEHPDAARDAKKSPDQRTSLRGQHVAALTAMHAVSRAVLDEVGKLGIKGAVAQQLRFMGEDNIQNPGAVKTLMKMNGRRYLAHGGNAKLGTILPSVKVHVLGPPTLEQSADIRNQRPKDPEYWSLVSGHTSFWELQATATTAAAGATPLFARRHRVAGIPLEAQWFCNRLRSSRGDELLQIVRELDKAMNNTSLILLMEVGRLKLLFPGDAQIENWQYTLKKAAAKSSPLRKLLQDVDVYKVGHHGSLNATPKTLWGMFMNHRKAAGAKGRLRTFMSTLPGKHGTEASRTEVPRRTLVDALRKDSTLVRTDELAAGVQCDVQQIPV